MFETRPNRYWLRPKDAGAHLSVTEDCLQAWRSKHKGPAWSKVGKVVRYHIDDLDDFLKGYRQGPPGKEGTA
jgi:hypothetical protein